MDGTTLWFTVNVTRIVWPFGHRLVVYYYDQTDIMIKEAEAKKAESRMKLMLDAAPLGCLLIENDFHVLDCNHELMNIFDVPFKQLITDDFLRFSPEFQPDGRPTREKALEYMNTAFQSNKLVFEWMHQGFNGEPIPAEVTLACIKHNDDSALVCYIRDLREMNTALAEADEANQRIRMMQDANPLMCVMRDDKGKIIDCNQAALNMLEVPDKEDFCENFYTFFPEYQTDGMRSVDKTDAVIEIIDREGSYHLTRTFQTRSGEIIPVETQAVRIPWKDSYIYLSFSRDLREYERLMRDEEASRVSMNKSVAVLENVDALISICDLDYNLLYMNQNMADVFGLNRDFCIGKKCYEVIRHNDSPCTICQLPGLLPYKDELPTQFDEYLWDEALDMWTESKASIIRWADDSLVFFHSINDRSVKKVYEDELRKAM
jgi:PAS domain-containing protein